jgi:hypothetical protein
MDVVGSDHKLLLGEGWNLPELDAGIKSESAAADEVNIYEKGVTLHTHAQLSDGTENNLDIKEEIDVIDDKTPIWILRPVKDESVLDTKCE